MEAIFNCKVVIPYKTGKLEKALSTQFKENGFELGPVIISHRYDWPMRRLRRIGEPEEVIYPKLYYIKREPFRLDYPFSRLVRKDAISLQRYLNCISNFFFDEGVAISREPEKEHESYYLYGYDDEWMRLHILWLDSDDSSSRRKGYRKKAGYKTSDSEFLRNYRDPQKSWDNIIFPNKNILAQEIVACYLRAHKKGQNP